MARRKTVAMVSARLTADDKMKFDAIAARTGLSPSGVVQALIRAADVQPVIAWRPTLGSGQEGVSRG